MFKGKEINNTKTYKDKIAKYFKGFIIIFNPKVYVNSNNLQPAQVSVTQGKIEWARQQEQEYSCQSRKAVLTEWRERWHKEQGCKASWPESITALDQPSQSCLKLYS
jgi:hypothetical protein